ncbi:MAG: hypothetical protein J5767_15075 [Paludibacteraceae bacterium]|nr:hypothetical protein [Paludibacteraceae bacterium]
MKAAEFNNISMIGRMAYGILCVESFLLNKYPDDDWTPLASLMWEATSSYWDTWDWKYIEIIPEFLFEKETFEESSFEYLSKEDYNLFSALLKGKDENVNTLLMKLHELQEVYCYTSIPGKGKEASQLIVDMCAILSQENIPLPDVSLVSFSSFSERDGWGEQFDGTKLSQVLTH